MKKVETEEGGGQEFVIRANQGHSMQDIAVDMIEVKETDSIDTIIHGTFYRAWDLIKTQVDNFYINKTWFGLAKEL